MRALVGGQVSADLADDNRVAGFARLDDIDAQAIPCGAGSLADVRGNTALFVFMPNMVFAMKTLDGVRRGVWHKVM